MNPPAAGTAVVDFQIGGTSALQVMGDGTLVVGANGAGGANTVTLDPTSSTPIFMNRNSDALALFQTSNSGGDVGFRLFNTGVPREWRLHVHNADGHLWFRDQSGSANRITIDTAGKVTVLQELEIDGDLNHDGTNVGLYGVAPVARATTGISEAAFVENAGGTAVNDDSTFGGYTLQQIAQALQDIGALT